MSTEIIIGGKIYAASFVEFEKGREEKMSSGEGMGENQKEGSGSTESGCSRLPKDIISLRNYSISLFVSNLKPTISKVELEAMFCRSGRIVDSFILTKKSIGVGCGFAFVRFKPLEEANRAVTDNNGKSWGVRRFR